MALSKGKGYGLFFFPRSEAPHFRRDTIVADFGPLGVFAAGAALPRGWEHCSVEVSPSWRGYFDTGAAGTIVVVPALSRGVCLKKGVMGPFANHGAFPSERNAKLTFVKREGGGLTVAVQLTKDVTVVEGRQEILVDYGTAYAQQLALEEAQTLERKLAASQRGPVASLRPTNRVFLCEKCGCYYEKAATFRHSFGKCLPKAE